MLDRGADVAGYGQTVAGPWSDVAGASHDDYPALMFAAIDGHEAAKLLPDHGADVASAKHNDETAPIFAAAVGSEVVAKQLLDHGADVAAASRNVVTALMAAANGGREAGPNGCWTMAQMWQPQDTMVPLRCWLLLRVAMRLWPNSAGTWCRRDSCRTQG